MRQTCIFFLAGDNDPEYLPHAEYLGVVRGNKARRDFANQTVRVVDWYTNRIGDGLRVENETYSYLAFDNEGRASMDLLDNRHPAGWEPSAEEIEKMREYLKERGGLSRSGNVDFP